MTWKNTVKKEQVDIKDYTAMLEKLRQLAKKHNPNAMAHVDKLEEELLHLNTERAYGKNINKQDDKKAEDEIERILNYEIYDESHYSREGEKGLESTLNESFGFKIKVEYVPDDSAYYISFKGKTYKFDKDGRFSESR